MRKPDITVAIRQHLYSGYDFLYFIDVVKGIDDKESGYDNSEERRRLEEAAKRLFG